MGSRHGPYAALPLAENRVDTVIYAARESDHHSFAPEVRHEVVPPRRSCLREHDVCTASDRSRLSIAARRGVGAGIVRRRRAGSGVPGLPELSGRRVAVPGRLTSAALAFSLRVPDAEQVVVPFDRIGEAVLAGEVDAGVLIHEGQLTWRDEGLDLVADLGALWKEETGLPLPLGGNVVRRDLGEETIGKVSRALSRSIEHALAHREEALTDAMRFARGLPREKADRFVGMYVNDWTRSYGERGREAVRLFLRLSYEAGKLPRPVTPEWVPEP
ncbi:hypothetical protein FBQ97_02945 [Acidobacteria bacterium ACD]|nr:hypothetical protein [Acidobacteria bacterium ACD]